MMKRNPTASFIVRSILAFLTINIIIGFSIQTAQLQTRIKQKDSKLYKEEIESEGYKYTYEAVPFEAEQSLYKGKITIRNSNNAVIYQEILDLQPGMCGKFPTISKFSFKLPSYKLIGGDPNTERWMVTICGSLTGKHKTLKVFFKDPISFKSTSLHFEDSSPNLSDIDGDGSYEAQVYRRVFFDGVGYGVIHYLTIYNLNIDSSIFGFSPRFDSKMMHKYFEYYVQLKKSLNPEIVSDYIGPMLGALLATQDRNKICGEIKTLRANGLTIKDLQTWEKRLNGLGYPSFDFNLCKEGLK